MKGPGSRLFAALAMSAALVALWGARAARGPLRKTVGDPCRSTRQDCGYGLECRVPLPNEPKPALFDGGIVSLPDAGPVSPDFETDGGPQKRCQYTLYAECSDEPGGPQCLSGQKCREGHCTVQCAADAECGQGGLCRIGVCARARTALTQCYDNRDCRWPESCFHGQCVTRTDAFRCNTDLDCGYGYRCLNGRCQ